MQTKQVNDHIIKPIVVGGKRDTRPVLGASLIPHLYSSIFLVAKKNSGKTTVVNHILKECAGQDTEIYAFAATMYNDPQWGQMKQYFRNKGITFKGYTSMVNNEGENVITKWLEERSGVESDSDDDEPEPEPVVTLRRSNVHLLVAKEPAEVSRPRRRKPSHQAPEAIFVFDDFSRELRDKVIADFIKRHRHYKTKIIISSQYVKDIMPATAQNIDIWILFKGLSSQFLDRVYELSGPSISREKYEELYLDATAKPYGFLYADTTAQPEFRKKFNERYLT